MSNKKTKLNDDLLPYPVITVKDEEDMDTAIFISGQNNARKKRQEVYNKAKPMVNDLRSKYREMFENKKIDYEAYSKIRKRLNNILPTIQTMDPMFNKLDEFDITKQQV